MSLNGIIDGVYSPVATLPISYKRTLRLTGLTGTNVKLPQKHVLTVRLVHLVFKENRVPKQGFYLIQVDGVWLGYLFWFASIWYCMGHLDSAEFASQNRKFCCDKSFIGVSPQLYKSDRPDQVSVEIKFWIDSTQACQDCNIQEKFHTQAFNLKRNCCYSIATKAVLTLSDYKSDITWEWVQIFFVWCLHQATSNGTLGW